MPRTRVLRTSYELDLLTDYKINLFHPYTDEVKKECKNLYTASRWGRYKFDDYITRLNMNILRKNSGQLSSNLERTIELIFFTQLNGTRHNKTGGGRNECDLFSNFAINEFLNSTKYATYGEFLNDEWDNCYDAMLKLQIVEYPHTVLVFSKNVNLFSHRKNLKKEQIDRIENLTKDDFKLLYEFPQGSLKAIGKGIIPKIDNLLNKKDFDKPKLDAAAISNRLTKAYAKTILNEDENSRVFYEKLNSRALTYVKEVIRRRVSKEIHKVDKNVLFIEDLDPITSFLLENADDFSMKEMLAIYCILGSTKTFILDGSYEDSIKFLNRIVGEKSPEEASGILKIISECMLQYNDVLPSHKNWIDAFEKDELDPVMTIDITMMFIASKINDEYHIPDSFRSLRQAVKQASFSSN